MAVIPKTPGIELRKAGPEDLPAIKSLVNSMLKEYGLDGEHHQASDLEDLERYYFKRGGDFQVVVSGKGKKQRVLGTLAMIPIAPYTCELRRMYLVPELRGQGLGKYLMDRALGTARAGGFREVELATSAVFTQANGLYKRFGFYPVERAPRGDGGKLFDQAFTADL